MANQPEDLDPRWIMCHRPSIIVGGELTARMLDLAYEPNSGTYLAPLQMQANNGILVIDDFGRQVLTPEQLLNRWIVPLDRQIDYLSLSYGVKFEVPFDAKIVFSTNLQPEVLGDEAFFRRIQSKLLIPAIDDEQFDEVLRRVCLAKGVEIAPGAPAHMRFVSREHGDGDLRPYLPGAVVKIMLSICEFRKLPKVLDNVMIDKVAKVYFTHSHAVSGAAASPGKTPLPAAPTIDAPPVATGPTAEPTEVKAMIEAPTEATVEPAIESAIKEPVDQPVDQPVEPTNKEPAPSDEPSAEPDLTPLGWIKPKAAPGPGATGGSPPDLVDAVAF